MAMTSAIFVGDGSLLLQCAGAYLEAGHEVRTIASANPAVLDWARARSIGTVSLGGATDIAIPDLEFDFLFSVANLRVLPIELIGRAKKLAINFHDGLLPRHAGLNATSWALIAQEPTHGVTWHEMTAAVDAGRIVRQATFPVAAQETALSLNAKCYEAGASTFAAMVDDLGRGDLVLAPQQGPRSYFGRDRRPDALGTLDFSKPATELCALVRALDFGPYPNPLARPKVLLGDRMLLVRSASLVQNSSGASPGTVLAVEGDSLRIATAQGDILLGNCFDPRGGALAERIAPGAVLPRLDAAQAQTLAARTPRIAAGEPAWTRAFARAEPVALPYPQGFSAAPARSSQQFHRVPLETPNRGAATVAAFLAWLSALGGQERVSVMYSDAMLAEQAKNLENWLSPWVPLTLATRAQSGTLEATALAEGEIARSRQAGPCPRDLRFRLGDKHPDFAALARIGVRLGGDAPPEGVELLLAADPSGHSLELVASGDVFPRETVALMAGHLAWWLKAFESTPGCVADVPLLPPGETQALAALNATETPFDSKTCVHEAIAAQVARSAGHVAISQQSRSVSYGELEERATALAVRLRASGVVPGDIVGLCLERTPDLVIALLAILKTGAAYLPLDPDYPRDRIAFMVADSGTRLVVTREALAASLGLAAGNTFLLDAPPSSGSVETTALPAVTPESAAYVIYTSGSTGRPKGVVVTHANVMNFFAGMAQRVPHDPAGRWLAVTSLSFDISVLELCWTLARGFTVVLHSNAPSPGRESPDFSLFYFASDSASAPADRYKLLLEGAKFADREGFAAIWTPERHFHAFGGLYPNPALTSAAIAAITTRLQIRAGSCVLPLHHPIRVAEEWAFVDNISQGRVGVSFAAGWQPNDFAIAPAAFADRKNAMLANIDVVRRLWRGESVAFPGPVGKPVDVQTLPRPIQKDLPIWLTAAGNPETFQQAGEMGCHLLTHLLGQTVDDVAQKLRLYRQAWRRAGHPGDGHVTLMLHTFVGPDDDAVRETVRQPMKEYLRSSVDLIRQAAWSFPTFVQRGAANGKTAVEIMDAAPLSPEEMDALLDHAFERYYGTSGLFGTPQRCMAMVDKLSEAGVDEIACLIDFGIATDTVLAHLHDLKGLMDACARRRFAPRRVNVAEEISRHAITHLQCTPSMAAMLVADAAGRAALSRLKVLMVGGEALPLDLARELRSLVPGTVLNMYGPTETTVWSTTCDLAALGDFVPLGQPIANTRLSIRNAWGMECPAGVPGELLIGGAGVTPGYLHRPDLTAERFAADAAVPGARLYRTGDLVRRHSGGALEFLGRIDHQVKIRGHRIELGEIESALSRQPGVAQAVVLAREDGTGDKRLVGYVTAQAGAAPDPESLRRELMRELPEVMVPAVVMLLPSLPLTPNGKVDRRALPAARPVEAARNVAAPQGELEQAIAAIWQEVLGLPQVDVAENFFDLGGHSLLVVQVQRRLREVCGQEVSITDMFRLPTIRALAAHLGGNATSSAVGEGLSRAQARRAMRSRATLQQVSAP
jgi:natural product biosynthesis luciferase-like monooxygenase protein